MNRGRALVLISHEDTRIAGAISWLLKEHGYDTVLASSRDDLVDRIASSQPDIVLLDTDETGASTPSRSAELLARVAANESMRDIPVLVTTSAPASNGSAFLPGAHDVIRKPYVVRELLARIETQLSIRDQLLRARAALTSATQELERVRGEAESGRKLVDILHDVAGDFSPEELSHMLVWRVARALNISHCSLVRARAGDEQGVVTASYEDPSVRDREIRMDSYPEIGVALERGTPVLIEDVDESPLYASLRLEFAQDGTALEVRSSIAVPFTLDDQGTSGGAFLLQTMRNEPPLTADDVIFAQTVVKAAVAAMRRAHAFEVARADKARLEVLATTDPLTHVLNRRALTDRLKGEMDRAQRYGLVLSLMILDLDHFKTVNDTFGHLVGDDVLRQVASLLQHEARSVDVVARYGGEEFVVVLPETAEEGALIFAERVRQKIAERPLMVGTLFDGVRITVSIGVATVPSPEVNNSEDLIALADQALYRAKGDGRNLVRG
ncbi:MAG: diguanylate cyclase [Gemmatimonadaceae bacterium]